MWRWRKRRKRRRHTPYTEDFQVADSLRPGTEGPGPASGRRARRGPSSPLVHSYRDLCIVSSFSVASVNLERSARFTIQCDNEIG